MNLFHYDPQYWWFMLPGSVKFFWAMIAVLFFTVRHDIRQEKQ